MNRLLKKWEFLLIIFALIIAYRLVDRFILKKDLQPVENIPTIAPSQPAHGDLTLDTFQIASNEAGNYTVNIPIQYTGTGSAELFSLYVTINDNIANLTENSEVRRLVIGHVDAKKPQIITIKNVVLPLTLNKVCAKADALNQIVELNEDNNIRCQTYSTRPPTNIPTLRPSRLLHTPSASPSAN